MALDTLLESLAHDADNEVRAILETARAEAERIGGDAAALVEQRCEAAVAAREAELALQADAERAHAVREARARVLEARQRFLDRVFERVEAGLARAVTGPEGTAVVDALVREAAGFFPDAGLVARCPAALAPAVRAALAGSSARVEIDESVAAGVVLEAGDGSMRVDNTLVQRVRRLRPALSIELLARAGVTP
jgi:vacuolar-type H+-ATPase subunit E/Vma4